MDIRGEIFTILLITFAFQNNVFAAERHIDEAEYLALLGAKDAPKALPLTPKDDKWGEPNNGFVTQLVPQNEEYVVGKPMRFGLVLKNVSDSVKQFDHQGISHNTLIIKDEKDNEPYYKKGPFQTQGAPHPIDANEIMTLFEGRDIADEYVIIEPGKYTIQFRGMYDGMTDSNFPASNVVEFEVKSGTPDDRDLLIASLFDILPDVNWSMLAGPRNHVPAGRKDAQGNAIALYRVRSRIRVVLWLTKIPAQVDEHSEDPQTSDYLGNNALGYFYITIPPKALDYWPKMKEDIAKALEINSPSGQNP